MVIDTAPPTGAQLARRLLALVQARAVAVADLELQTDALIEARTQHDGFATNYTLAGLEGRNEGERAASLKALLTPQRMALTDAEGVQRRSRAQLEQIDAELSVLKALARLQGGPDA